MKNTLKILAVMAVLALAAVQYFIISNVYKVLKQNVLSTMGEDPYRVLFSKMFLLVLASALIIAFVIYCLIRVWKMLSKVTRENNMRKDHTYAMIHDMKTPLSAINLVADDLGERFSLQPDNKDVADEDLYHDVRILREESAHLNRICEMVIKVAKLESDKLQFVFEDVALSEFLPGVTEKFTPSAKVGKVEKSVSIKIDVSKAEVVNTDPLYLAEILDNLIDNSIKYSGENVEISIECSRYHARSLVNMPGIERLHIWPNKKFVEIKVKDNGIGIDEETKNKLFKKFERGENTVEISGHGIGLHYVYQLMKMMGGYVKVDSRVGDGTTVTLGFPED